MLEYLVNHLASVILSVVLLFIIIIVIIVFYETSDKKMNQQKRSSKTPLPEVYTSETMDIVLNFYHSNNIIIPIEIIDEHEYIDDTEELFQAIEESRKIWKLENSKPIPKSKMKKLLNE